MKQYSKQRCHLWHSARWEKKADMHRITCSPVWSQRVWNVKEVRSESGFEEAERPCCDSPVGVNQRAFSSSTPPQNSGRGCVWACDVVDWGGFGDDVSGWNLDSLKLLGGFLWGKPKSRESQWSIREVIRLDKEETVVSTGSEWTPFKTASHVSERVSTICHV